MREFSAVCMIIGKKEEKIIQTKKRRKVQIRKRSSFFSRICDFKGANEDDVKAISCERKQKEKSGRFDKKKAANMFLGAAKQIYYF